MKKAKQYQIEQLVGIIHSLHVVHTLSQSVCNYTTEKREIITCRHALNSTNNTFGRTLLYIHVCTCSHVHGTHAHVLHYNQIYQTLQTFNCIKGRTINQLNLICLDYGKL